MKYILRYKNLNEKDKSKYITENVFHFKDQALRARNRLISDNELHKKYGGSIPYGGFEIEEIADMDLIQRQLSEQQPEMSAKDIFKELGFIQASSMRYVKKDNDRICIWFHDSTQTFSSCVMDQNDNGYERPITLPEFKAIQQQMKEFGWI